MTMMLLVKVHRAAQITRPGSVRAALRIREGDYLQAELVEGGILLRPVAAMDQGEALNRLDDLLGKGRGPVSGEELTEDEVMTLALDVIEDVRRRKREGRF